MPLVGLHGVELYYESSGEGFPIVFSHEFGGGYQSWQPQVRYFDRWYRCITYNHRGFPPSSVPEAPDAYAQDLLIEDLRALLAQLGLGQVHLVGLSLGGNVALNFALRYPDRCRSVVVAGTGTGSINREEFERDVTEIVEMLSATGMRPFAERYALGAARVTYRRKDPQGWDEFREQLAHHSALGSRLTMQGVMLRRPTIFALEERLNELTVPALIVVGDEDEPCLDPAVFMKRHIPGAGLLVLPQTGHAVNLEEPLLFNQGVLDFLRLVEAGRWPSGASRTTALLPQHS